MTDGDKAAAATLAAEAARQAAEQASRASIRSQHDAAGTLWRYYLHFLGEIKAAEASAAAERQRREAAANLP